METHQGCTLGPKMFELFIINWLFTLSMDSGVRFGFSKCHKHILELYKNVKAHIYLRLKTPTLYELKDSIRPFCIINKLTKYVDVPQPILIYQLAHRNKQPEVIVATQITMFPTHYFQHHSYLLSQTNL